MKLTRPPFAVIFRGVEMLRLLRLLRSLAMTKLLAMRLLLVVALGFYQLAGAVVALAGCVVWCA